jgi:CelD/BcsL family acetyltransferase involved in cellulose biosynthesis
MISIEIVENSSRLMGMRAEWNELLEKSDSDCLFLTWEWLSMWWRHLAGDRRLFMPAVRDQGELVAIAPLVLRPPGISTILPLPALEFMGTGSVGSDYLDVIIRRGHEDRAMTAMAECLAEVNRAVELEQVKVHGCAAAGLGRILVGRGWGVWEEETNISRHIDLAGKSWPAYLAGVGAAHRYNFNRRLRQLGRQFEVRFEKTEREEERRQALGRLIALHRARWGNYSRAFHTPHHVRFHEEISRLAGERGWLRIFTLWLDGEAVAALYGFRYGRVFYFYQSGFDPIYARYSTGLVTMGLSIESAIEEGVEEYDMLQGLEQYKEPWAGGVRPLGRLEFYPPHVRGLIHRRTMKPSRTAKRAARPHWEAAPSSALDMAASGRPAAVGRLSRRQGP